MSSNVINLVRSASDQLRYLADQIDAGKHPCEGVTVIAGTEVFYCSALPETQSATNVVWDCTYAISKLMERIHDR